MLRLISEEDGPVLKSVDTLLRISNSLPFSNNYIKSLIVNCCAKIKLLHSHIKTYDTHFNNKKAIKSYFFNPIIIDVETDIKIRKFDCPRIECLSKFLNTSDYIDIYNAKAAARGGPNLNNRLVIPYSNALSKFKLICKQKNFDKSTEIGREKGKAFFDNFFNNKSKPWIFGIMVNLFYSTVAKL